MNPVDAYIPIDRRLALTTDMVLPEESSGAALFVDISGFTPLTGALVHHLGARRGAEELTKWLNRVYTALIAEVDTYRGTVIGFSGDAITCWFAATEGNVSRATLRATITGLAIQRAMTQFRALRLDYPTAQHGGGATFSLAVKTAIAAGAVRRFTVGEPAIQLIDVLAGTTLDRMAATEAMAGQNELLIDEPAIAPIQEQLTIAEWRIDGTTGRRYARVSAVAAALMPEPWPPCPPLADDHVRAWILPTIAERLKGQQSRFLAELRPAAALFLRFTGLDFDHDGDSPLKLDQYIRWVQSIIDQHEGALIQLTTGDKGSYLYATFGAPIAHDDDIQRAVAAAILLRQPPAQMPFIMTTQIGITYGMMRVGAYGGETRKTYGVLGTETNMAARLMTHAIAGQIVISSDVAEVAREHYEIVDIGKHKLKGKSEPQQLFAVQGVQQDPGRGEIPFTTKLVGRDAEIQQLFMAAEQIDGDHGRVVRISGSAGLGKSHLAASFARIVEELGFRVITAGAQSTAQGTAYFAVRPLVCRLLELDPSERQPSEERIIRLRAKIDATNPQWDLRLPLLGDLLGLPIPDNATTATFDARLRQEALTTLIVEIVQHFTREQRHFIVLEDIHWLDEASQGVVLAMARATHTIPLLLLLLHRPPTRENEPFFHELNNLATATNIVLQELPSTSIVALVEERLNGTIAPLAASLIHLQAQGNPFFTEELVDALVESGQLQQQEGSWQLDTELVGRLRSSGGLVRRSGEEVINPEASLTTIDLGIPGTIQGIILARLDRLPEPVKLTVKVASVIGRVFSHELLRRAHPAIVENEVLDRELATLLTREFARIEVPAPHATYIFKHNITQEVVYQTLLTDQRQELHLGVAIALETIQPDRVEDLATHYYNSNLDDQPLRAKALHYLDAAGQRAKHDYANETALNYFDQALNLEKKPHWLKAKVEILHILGRRDEEHIALAGLAGLPDSDSGDLALLQGNYFEALSDYETAQHHLQEALRYHQQHANLRGEVQCMSQLALILVRQADYDEAQRVYQATLTLTAEQNDLLDERASLLYGVSVVNRQQGNYAAAQSQLEIALDLYRTHGNRQGEARMLTGLGIIAHLQRDYRTAETYYHQALMIQQIIGDRAGEGASLISLGQVARSQEDWSEATKYILQGQNLFTLLGNRWWQSRTLNELGVINLIIGDFAKAQAYLDQSLMVSRELNDSSVEAIALLNMGQVVREQGHDRQAIALHHESNTIAQTQGDLDLEAQNLSDLAICHIHLHQPEAAIHFAQRALHLFEQLGVTAALTAEFCTLAEAYVQRNDITAAKQYAGQALELLNQLGGEGPDYPHRDYFNCYRIFAQLDCPAEAQSALDRAYAILEQKATNISDPVMRASFLTNVTFNRAILQAINGKSRSGDPSRWLASPERPGG